MNARLAYVMCGVQCPLEAGRTRWRDESGEQQFRQNYKDSREVSSMTPGLLSSHSDLSSMSQMWPLLVSPHTKYAIETRRQFIRFWSYHRKTTRIKYASFGLVKIIAHKRMCITKHPRLNVSWVTRGSISVLSTSFEFQHERVLAVTLLGG